MNTLLIKIEEGIDLTDILGIQKWEAPISAQLAGMARGNFPSRIAKTDQERCLDGDSVLVTNTGPKTIREIVDAKLDCSVLAFNHDTNTQELNKVIGWQSMSRTKQWVRITTKQGKVLTVTGNHRIWIEALQCYRQAAELKVGDFLKIQQ